MRPIPLLIFILAGLAIPALPASARLGESEAQAWAHDYSQFGAVLPTFESDAGHVVLECWSSPPTGWTEEQAMAFAKLLLPDKIKDETPRELPSEASEKSLVFGDGTRIAVSEVGVVVFNVEVSAPGYAGSAC